MVAAAVTLSAATFASGFTLAPASAVTPQPKVLINTATVVGGSTNSIEAQKAVAAGFAVTNVSAAQWAAMTASDFAQYDALVIGDPSCSSVAASVTNNITTWAPVVLGKAGGRTQAGNRVVIGTDPVFHRSGHLGADHLIQDGIAFAGAQPGRTGVYFDISCNPVTSTITGALSALSAGTGNWVGTTAGCGNGVSKIASNSKFDSLVNADLQGWGCSIHESFSAWASDWYPLVIDVDAVAKPVCGTDSTSGAAVCGSPYVLIAGSDIVVTSPNLALTPATATNPAGGTHTVTANVKRAGVALAGQVITFSLTGTNAGVTGTCTASASCASDASGNVSFTYTDTNGAGDDTVTASFKDASSGSTQTATAAVHWNASPQTITVTPSDRTITYDTAEPSYPFTAASSGSHTLTTQATCSVVGAHLNVGTYPITCSGATAPAGDTIVYNTGTLTVNPAPFTVTAVNQSITYGSPLPTFSSEVSGLPSGTPVTGTSCFPSGGMDAGSHPITCTSANAGANYRASYTDGTLTIAPAPVTVTGDDKTMQYGQPAPDLTYSVTGLYAPDVLTTNPTCGLVGGGHVGTQPITCTGATAGPNYTVTSVPGTLTITPAPVTITAKSASTTYGVAAPTFTSTVTGLVGTDKLATPATCGVAVAHTAAATYPLTCSGAKAATDYTVSYVAGTYVVAKANGIITPAPQTVTYGDSDPTFDYTVSGLLPGDSLTTPPTCGVTGDHVNVASYDIACTGADGSPNYTVDETATALLVVQPRTITIQPHNVTTTYGTDPSFDWDTDGLVHGDTLITQPVCDVAGDHSSAGTYPITCTGGDAGSNYAVTSTGATLTVLPKVVTVTPPNASQTYGGSSADLTPGISGLVGADTLPKGPTCAPDSTVHDVGDYTVVCTGANGGTNYTVDQTATSTLTVLKAPLSVVVDNTSRLYGAANPVLTGVVTGVIGTDAITAHYSTLAGRTSPIGGYAIDATLTGAELGNYEITNVSGMLTVNKAAVLVTPGDQGRYYGEDDPAFSAIVTGLVNDDELVATPNCSVTVAHVNVGTYPISCTATDAGHNYVVDQTPTAILTVAAAPLTVTADNLSRTYGTANPELTYAVTGLVPGDHLSVDPACAVHNAVDVGSYPVACSGADAGTNYAIGYVDGSLTVTPAVATIAAVGTATTYGKPTPAFTATTKGLVPGDHLTVQPTCDVPANHTAAGSYPITCSGADGGKNYTLTYVEGSYTVSKAAGVVTPNAQTKTYGDKDPAFTYSVTGLVNGEALVKEPTCSVAGTHVTAQSYVIGCTGANGGNNYTVDQSATAPLTVTPKAVVISPNNQSTTYGESDPTFTYNTAGLIGDDSLTVEPTCSVVGPHTLAGDYPITCTGGAAGQNYAVSSTTATLTVKQAPVTITPGDKTRMYGSADPAFTPVVSGLVGSESLPKSSTCSVSGTHSNVGTYVIACTGANGGRNYRVDQSATAVLTVTKAPLSVVANSFTRLYNTANPTYTGQVTGVVNHDAIAATYSSTAAKTSDVGSYPIVAALEGAGLANYTVTNTSGTLTVNPMGTILVITSSAAQQLGNAVPVTAQLTESLGGASIATQPMVIKVGSLSKTATGSPATATFAIANGSNAVSATFAGSKNYLSSSSAQTLVTFQATTFVVWGGNAGGVAPGSLVNFWGAKWNDQVVSGNAQAANQFKGFASTVSGSTWSGTGGASSGPPASIGQYVSVIVATTLTSSNGVASGNIAKTAVVKVTNPASYAPNPGSPAGGTVSSVS